MNTKNKLKYFLYARKSSESEDRQVQSIDDQINRLKALANNLGLHIVEILTESKSAKNPNGRVVFNEMLDRIEKGDAQGILVWQINRLSRNPVDSGRISWLLQQNIIQSIQTIDKEYLPNDNVILFNVESGVANQFIIDLKKSSKRGMESKAEKGHLPSRAPIGYLNDKLNNVIIKDPERFDLVRKMWDMMLTGNYTPVQIMRIANSEWGFRTNKTKRSGGSELVSSVIYRIFNNIFYAGMFEWSGNLYKGEQVPMISMEEFDRVQILLGKDGRPRKKTHDFAYTGIIRCGVCGCMYTATEKTKIIKKTNEIKTYVYYHCTKRKTGVKCTDNSWITLEELEDQIDFELARNTIHPKFQEWALNILNKNNEKEVADRTAIYENQQRAVNETQKELDNLTKMRLKELIDDEEFIKTKEELKAKILKLRENLKNTEDRTDKWQELTENTFYFSRYAREKFIKGGLQTKREIFSALGQNFSIINKKLLLNKNEWFIPIEKAYPELKKRFDALELDKTLTEQERNRRIRLIISDWGRIVEEVRTGFELRNVVTIYIPTFTYINTN